MTSRLPEPGEDEHGDVMVPVQEDERLLPQHNEHRVHELRDLGHGEEVAPQARHGAVGYVAVGKREWCQLMR